MEKKINVVFVFILGCLIGICAAFYFHYKEHKDNANQVIVPDTTYNKVVLDSIEYNIIKKDSVIYKIKQEMKDEVTKSFGLNDSAVVELFKKLVSTD